MNFNKRDYRNDYVRKSLRGEKYTFKVGKFIAEGGNGLVYEISSRDLD